MKKGLLILIALPMIGFGQQTYVPDNNFEAYLEANGMGNSIANDNYVTTANINTVTYLDVSNNNITNLIGIQEFIDLEHLNCYGNQLTSLDVSNNLSLTNLNCYNNYLTNLDVSTNTALTNLECNNNQLTSLYVSNNTALTSLSCNDNFISCLDVSINLVLTNLNCSNNLIDQLNTKNGNWINNLYVNAMSNNLLCAEVDNIGYATNNWLFDSFTSLNTNCNYSNPCNMTYGCTDLLACNYNSSANIDDSSCVYPTTASSSVIACDSFTWPLNGLTYATSVNDTVVGVNAAGCTETNILNLTIIYSNSSFDTLSVIVSIVWNGQTYTSSGDYSVILINSVGCDSIANLNLTITNTTGISDIANNKCNLVKITNILGKETPYRKNTPLFYIYSDGTVEKRIIIE